MQIDGKSLDQLMQEASKASEAVELGGEQRPVRSWEKPIFYWLGVAYVLFHFYVLLIMPMEEWLFVTIHVGGALVIGFGLFAAIKGDRREGVPWYDWLMIAATVACSGYIVVNLDALLFRAGVLPEPADLAVSIVGILLVLEMTRRTSGLSLPIIALIFVAYVFVGPWLPGVLHHTGYEVDQALTYLYSANGVFGQTASASATFILLFIAFAAFLQASGTGDYFNNLAIAGFGHLRGGPAKVTVISGILFGTISGSAVANVVASGMFTIPLMRRVGYRPQTAAAIEATSSTGGQITPPVMGAGAFIMAEVTGIPYSDIAFAAIMPAVLFYIACYAHVDLNARRNGLHGLPRNELPSLRLLAKTSYLILPLVILIGCFMMGYSPIRAAAVGLVATVVVSWLDAKTRMGPLAVLNSLEGAARGTVQIAAICACAGLIVGVIALTGLGHRFSVMILSLARESQLLALVFAMFITLVLGTGMPTTAAYAVGASVVAPGLVRLGIEPLVAHLFVFYYAIVGAITPPVALASFAAAGLAKCDPWRTSVESVKIGLAILIVPFMFVYGPELLMKGSWIDILPAIATASLGVYLLAASTEGWLHGPLSLPLRVVLFAGALLLIVPELYTDLGGAAIATGVFLIQRARNGRTAPA